MNRLNPLRAAWNVLGFVDENGQLQGTQVSGFPVLRTPRDANALFRGEEVWYICAIGDNAGRARLAAVLDANGWRAASLVHPSAIVADSATIGSGTYIGAGAVICPHAAIGDHVIINTHASIGHDAVLGHFSQAGPGARVSGGCRIGDHVLLGSNAAVLPGIAVGAAAVVGACSQVIRTVPPHVTVAGVPARIVCDSTDKR